MSLASSVAGSMLVRLISGVCAMAKIAVIGITPNALNDTQKSVLWVRQMI